MTGVDRRALLGAIQGITSGPGAAEDLSDEELFRSLYPVPSQAKAFNLDKILVVGGRGTGKTQIFRALLDPKGREAVARTAGVKLVNDVAKMILVEGFSAGRASQPDHPNHPAADAIEAVLEGDDGVRARRFWVGVCLARILLNPAAAALLDEKDRRSLQELTGNAAASPRTILGWVESDVERPFAILDALDRAASARGQSCVVTFDALDRVANRWETFGTVVGGLLSLALDVYRRNRAVRLKIFLRPDLESDAALSFPDASKLRGYREQLEWSRADLYRLVFKRMMAEPRYGEEAHRSIEGIVGPDLVTCVPPLGWVPEPNFDEPRQEAVMTHLAGRYMGANARKGLTYTWVPNHLADAQRQVSPRSFLVALSKAAEEMIARPAVAVAGTGVLSPTSLMEGVTAASTQRVEELAEDFPWIRDVRRAMQGLLVPCRDSDLLDRLSRLELTGAQKGLRSSDPRSILGQLAELGVVYANMDGRYNVPDLYRVGMNMKRKGGIRLVR